MTMPARGPVVAATLAMIVAVNGQAGQAGQAGRAPTSLTFTKDVAPILYKNCVSCHRPGEMGPMSLITYADVRPFVRAIRENVASRTMPPWHADPKYGTYANDRSLSQKEIDTIVAWVDGGARPGDAADMPKLPDLVAGWQIDQPDAVFELPASFDIPPTGTIAYKSFNVPTNFTQDMWVTAAEVRVEDRAHVHHAVVTIQAPGGNKPLNALQIKMLSQSGADRPLTPEEQARQKTGAGRSASTEHRLAGYAVGEQPPVFPAGLAKRVPAGAVLNFSMHYTTNGTPGRDRTKIGLIFAKEPPKGEIFMGLINNGKDMVYTAIYPDGGREILLSVPKYRFDWQLDYYLAEPKLLPRGTKIIVTAHFDNSPANKINPDPSRRSATAIKRGMR